MMHIVEIHGEMVRNLVSSSEYFFNLTITMIISKVANGT